MKSTTRMDLATTSSSYRHKTGVLGRMIDKTINNGLYTTAAKNIKVFDRHERIKYELGDAIPLEIDEIYDYGKVLPKAILDKTLGGILYNLKVAFGATKNREKERYLVTFETHEV
jgi:hypothetical protein